MVKTCRKNSKTCQNMCGHVKAYIQGMRPVKVKPTANVKVITIYM